MTGPLADPRHDTAASARWLPAAPSPGAVRLAELLCVAARIEPQLMRRVRLALLPHVDVGAEADLWFSDWVASRGADSIVLRPVVVAHLQRRLAQRLTDEPNTLRAANRAWELLTEVHRRLPPAVRLEEHVTWLSVRPGGRDEIDAALRPALHALRDEGRTGVAGWYSRAWRRLPDTARRTVTAWQLAQLANRHTGPADVPLDAPTPASLALDHVTEISPALGDAYLRIDHAGDHVVIAATVENTPRAEVDASRVRAWVPVPDSDPRAVVVGWPVASGLIERTVLLRRGALTRLRVGPVPVWLRTGRGAVYEVEPPKTTPTALTAATPIRVHLVHGADAAERQTAVRAFWCYLRGRGFDATLGSPDAIRAAGRSWTERITRSDYLVILPSRISASANQRTTGDPAIEPSPTALRDLIPKLASDPSWQGRLLGVLLAEDRPMDLPSGVAGLVDVHIVTELTDVGAGSLLAALRRGPRRSDAPAVPASSDPSPSSTSSAPPGSAVRVVNPFALGDRDGRLPLVPWRFAHHRECYVPVGDTEKAFLSFTYRAGKALSSRQRGLLVVVSGETGCGKTSLIHRCIDHLYGMPSAGGDQTIIVDLLTSGAVRDLFMLEREAVPLTCVEVGTRLRQQHPSLSDLPVQPPAAFYRALSDELTARSLTLIIALPRLVDVETQLTAYRRLTHPGIVFFMETTEPHAVRDWLAGIAPAERENIITLEVGPLARGESWRYASDLLSRTPVGEPSIVLDQTSMDHLESVLPPMSIRTLHRLLSGLWERVVGAGSPRGITADDVQAHLMEVVRGYPSARNERP